MAKIFDKKLLKFILVGAANTLVGAGIMFLLYNIAHFNYVGATATANILGSTLSFFLNKTFTFQNKDSIWKTALRFAVNVAVCYVLAYSIAKPLVTWALEGLALEKVIVDNISMLFGMCLFTALNYFGQRFFAFREKRAEGQ